MNTNDITPKVKFTALLSGALVLLFLLLRFVPTEEELALTLGFSFLGLLFLTFAVICSLLFDSFAEVDG
jgi:ABC-type transport system involved in multi-copper enzyme maturation permease subunit